jgi:hypothetical protein
MECLGLHNKPTAEVHPRHMLTGPKEEEEEEEEEEPTTLTLETEFYRNPCFSFGNENWQ